MYTNASSCIADAESGATRLIAQFDAHSSEKQRVE